MSYETIKVERDGPLLIITLNRPDRLNAMPPQMAEEIGEWAEAGFLNIIGGCCGTTPDHIAAIAQAADAITPRKVPTIAPTLRLSGLEPFQIAV